MSRSAVRSSTRLSALVPVLSLLVAGCGGGGGGGGEGGGGNNGTGGSYPDASTALADVGLRIAAMTATEPGARLNEIAAYLATRPEFAASGISTSTGSVWGRDGDGVLYAVTVNAQTPGSGSASNAIATRPSSRAAFAQEARETQPRSAAKRLESTPRSRLAANRVEMPAGPAYVAGSRTWSADYLSWTVLENTLNLVSNCNYELDNPPGEPSSDKAAFVNAGIPRLGTVLGVGLLYLHTRVSAGLLPDGSELAGVMTSTDVTPTSEASYRSMLRDGSLIIMDAPNPDAQRAGPARMQRFGITQKFIRERMKLGQDALVYLDAGHGDHPQIRQAFLDIGASAFLGWSGETSSEDLQTLASSTFLKLMAGEWVGNGIHPGAPPTRPFDYRSAHSAVLTKYGREQKGAVPAPSDPTLKLTEGGGNLAIITPSIAYLMVDEYPSNAKERTALLFIHGSFGSDPGSAAREVGLSPHSHSAAGGEALVVTSWTPSLITCELPDALSGNVYVIARGRKSNLAPLTEWLLSITLRPSRDQNFMFEEATFDLRIRLDVHGYRNNPAQASYIPLPPAALYGDENSVNRYSSGSWRAWGEYTQYASPTHTGGLLGANPVSGVNPGSLFDPATNQFISVDPASLMPLWWRRLSGSGAFAYDRMHVGSPSGSAFYAEAYPYAAAPSLTAAGPPPLKVKVNLRYNAIGERFQRGGYSNGVPDSTLIEDLVLPFMSPLAADASVSPGWNFELELDTEFEDPALGIVRHYAIKAGNHESLSWDRTVPNLSSRPDDQTPR